MSSENFKNIHILNRVNAQKSFIDRLKDKMGMSGAGGDNAPLRDNWGTFGYDIKIIGDDKKMKEFRPHIERFRNMYNELPKEIQENINSINFGDFGWNNGYWLTDKDNPGVFDNRDMHMLVNLDKIKENHDKWEQDLKRIEHSPKYTAQQKAQILNKYEITFEQLFNHNVKHETGHSVFRNEWTREIQKKWHETLKIYGFPYATEYNMYKEIEYFRNRDEYDQYRGNVFDNETHSEIVGHMGNSRGLHEIYELDKLTNIYDQFCRDNNLHNLGDVFRKY